jgi:ABC-2 type transport system ATP-binding protein
VLQSAGMTILISSHVLSDLAELCTSIGIMELGSLVESASLKTLYERLSHQQIHIGILNNPQVLIQELKQYSWVENCEIIPDSQRVKVDFTGNLEDSANLLRSLILAGLPITEFHTSQEDLETIFLKLGHQQAS